MTAWPLVPHVEPAGDPPDAPSPASLEPLAPLVRRTRQVVLVVEADVRMGRFLKTNIETQGFRAIAATEIGEARRLADLEAPDLVLLDGGVAATEGYAPLRRLLADAQCPILVLARTSDPLACADALDLGAADWLARPFSTEELLARMRATLRKHSAAMPDAPVSPVTCGELTVDFAQRRVSLGNDAVALSKTEYKLLRALAQHPGVVLSHDVLLERVWGPGYGDAVAFVWVYIRRLRRKIEPDPANPRYILTVPGVGYRLARG
jgi:DNA-binding response OmpR family regulator